MEDQLLETLKSIYRIVLDNVPIIQSTEDIKPKNTIHYPTHVCCKDALNEGLTTSFVLKRKKVYCSDCEWFSHLLFKTTGNGYVYPVDEKDCVHPDNCGTWELKDQSNLHPSEINTKNDCSWFTVKLDGRN